MSSPKTESDNDTLDLGETVGRTIEHVQERQSWITYISWLMIALFLGSAVWTQSWSAVFLAILLFVLTLIPFVFQSLANFRLPRGFVGAIVFFLIATLLLGEYYDFYERFWWWDAVLHTSSAIGFALIGMMIVVFMLRAQRIQKASPFMLSMMAFSFALSIGALWEILEFGMDQLLGMNMQKSGLVDTMFDLIVDAIGAFIGSVGGYIYLKTHKVSASNPLTKTIEDAVENNPHIFESDAT